MLFNNPLITENPLRDELEVMKSNLNKFKYHQTFNDYTRICDWAIRRQEYSFVINTFEKLEKQNKKLNVLDVGCGVVPLCNHINKMGKHNVVAIDPIEDDVNFLVANNINSLYGSNVRYIHGYGEQLPFDDNVFDVVYSVSVLEHIASGNDLVVLSEMLRVLKTGGRLILTLDVMPDSRTNIRQYTYPFTSKMFLTSCQTIAT